MCINSKVRSYHTYKNAVVGSLLDYAKTTSDSIAETILTGERTTDIPHNGMYALAFIKPRLNTRFVYLLGRDSRIYLNYYNGESWRGWSTSGFGDMKIYIANGSAAAKYKESTKICTIELNPNKIYLILGMSQIDKGGIESIMSCTISVNGSGVNLFNIRTGHVNGRTTTSNGGGAMSCLMCKTGPSSAEARLGGYGYFDNTGVNYVGFMYAIEFPGDIQVFY